MFSGRIIQNSLILSVFRRAKTSEHSCPKCVVLPKLGLPVSDCLLASKKPCGLRFYSSHDRDFGTKMATSSDPEVKPKHSNRLIHSKSPYLLQHAHNPVDWYPWGEEAFEKARKEDKLIFLSVGYSTCHWCHVMERESFENEDIAKVMNEHFVNIKVDREERPDVDKVYMTFVQACSGSGGWPMSVFLKPDLKPVSGGTYYPPEDRYGRRGFKSELLKWAKEWKENKTQWVRVSDSVTEVIRNATVFEVPMSENLISGNVPGSECWELCAEQLAEHYEPSYGGFSLAPKFPQPSNLMFAFHVVACKPTEQNKKLRNMVLHTLNMMARGGIHDHVGKGFARYSTDMKWHVPHFEKMLYDQAQLAVVYSQAFLATKDPVYEATVRDILSYVARDLSHKDGGFYSAEDADSYPTSESKEKREGAFCVWTHEEVTRLLNQPVEGKPDLKVSEVFCHHYNVRPGGNVDPSQDPHKELTHQNVLMEVSGEEETAAKFGLPVATVRAALSSAREILYAERLKRPKPHLDNKVLTSWNGLMVSGFAKAGEALEDENLVNRAILAAEFIRTNLYDKTDNVLLRSCYTDEQGNAVQILPPIIGFLDDYAFLIQGLLDLYEASLEARWLEWAEQLQVKQDELFWDVGTAGYYSTPHHSDLILRLKEDQDGAEPSGNSVSCHNLLRLATLLDRPKYKEKAAKLLASFTSRLTSLPLALPLLTSALMLYHDSPTQIIITGKMSDPNTASLVSVIRSRLIPDRVLILADGDTNNFLYRNSETIRRLKTPSNDLQSAYVCRNHTCSLPVQTSHDLAALLDASTH